VPEREREKESKASEEEKAKKSACRLSWLKDPETIMGEREMTRLPEENT